MDLVDDGVDDDVVEDEVAVDREGEAAPLTAEYGGEVLCLICCCCM